MTDPLPSPWRRRRAWLAGAFLALGASWLVALAWPAPDEAALQWVDDHLDEGQQRAWREASWPGHTWVGLAAAGSGALTCLAIGRRRHAAAVALAACANVLAVHGLKLLLRRDRPDGVVLATFAFPSGHAATATVAWGLLALIVVPALAAAWPRLQPSRPLAVGVAAGLALATGVARVLGGVHWPSDVVAGWAFGVGLLTLAVWAAGPARASLREGVATPSRAPRP